MTGQGCAVVVIRLSLYDRLGIIGLLLAVWFVYWYIVNLPEEGGGENEEDD